MQNEIIFTLTRHVRRIQHKTETDCLACFFSYDNSKSVIFSILSEFTNLCNQANSGRILIRSFPELAIESNKFDARLSLMIGSGLFFSLTITVNRLSFLANLFNQANIQDSNLHQTCKSGIYVWQSNLRLK